MIHTDGRPTIANAPLRPGYPVRLTKLEARLLMGHLTVDLDYDELGPEGQALYDKLARVL